MKSLLTAILLNSSRNSLLPLSTPPTTPGSLREKRRSFASLSAIIEVDPSSLHQLSSVNDENIPRIFPSRQMSLFERISSITNILRLARLPTFKMFSCDTAASAQYPCPSLPPFRSEADDVFAVRVPLDGQLPSSSSNTRFGTDTRRNTADTAV